MKEEQYFFLRKFFFWLIFFLFFIFTPIILYNSLGYKFDESSRKFLKTGAMSIKTSPRGASIILNDVKLDETTPATLRELFPKKYTVVLQKKGFYSYRMPTEVKPSLVCELDVVLLPERRHVEKIEYAFNVHRFFITPYFFSEKFTLFTDRGIYLVDSDFKNMKKISTEDIGQDSASRIEKLRYWNSRLIYWGKGGIWMVEVPEDPDQPEKPIVALYQAENSIKQVFFGFSDRYLIVHDGNKILAIDVLNPTASFQIYELNSSEADVFYDSHSDLLFVRDTLARTGFFSGGAFSLFKIELLPIINEKKTRRETQKNS